MLTGDDITLKIIKYLKPFTASIIVIIILLLIQAMCDLALPDYTSNIVNIGIQQGGIKDAVPEAIRKSELEKLTFFMNDTDKSKVTASYILLDKNSLASSDYASYIQQYPKLADEPIYKLHTSSDQERNELNAVLGKSIFMATEWEKNPAGATSPHLANQAVKQEGEEKLAQLPDSIIVQSAVTYIHNEYQQIGMNTNSIQSRYILNSGVIMLLIALLSMAVSVMAGFQGAKVAAGYAQNLRGNLFKKVVGFSNTEFDKFSTASLITRSTNDIQQIQMMMIMMLRIVFYAPLLGIGGVIKVLGNDSSMGWIIVIALTAILILVSVLFGIAIPKFKKMQKLVDRLNLVSREMLTGIMVIRAFNNQNHAEQKFAQVNQDLTKTNLFVNRMMALMMPAMMLIMNTITLLIVWVGAHQIDSGAMQVGNMMAFIQYTMQIIMAFLMISMVSIMFPRASVSAERIGEVLQTETTIKDAPDRQQLDSQSPGRIEFKNVCFRYPGAEQDGLENITFTARPGQTTAIIGSTGSGKTTLINLILRFYDVTGGQILIDGIDISKLSQHDLRAMIGYVPQKAVLFSGTIESNLKYAGENTAWEDLDKAAQIAQAREFIESKPEGFQAEISQGGNNVSGGQKQRLSIARAIVKRPKIYIFDDSFSALDYKTDAALRKALKEETQNSTVLIVAQRLSTIINADQIIVLEEGKITGIGQHNELLKSCEVYQQIALSQLSQEELAI